MSHLVGWMVLFGLVQDQDALIQGKGWSLGYKDALYFKTADDNVKVKSGGRLQFDWAYTNDDDALAPIGDVDGGWEFRRVRLEAGGEFYKAVDFKIQFDFVGNTDFKDVWMGFKTPVGHFKVGHFKAPFSLDAMTGSNYVTFLERATPVEAFAPFHRLGIGWQKTFMEDKLLIALMFNRFALNDGREFDFESEYGFTGRAAYRWDLSEGNHLHLGLAYHGHSGNEQDQARARSRPELHLVDRFIDTGAETVDWAHTVGLETALLFGALHAQAEVMFSRFDLQTGDDLTHWGAYLQLGYFLTGEARPYKKGSWSGVKPTENLAFDAPGMGAFELAARVSYLSLETAADTDDTLLSFTVGANWYPNPNTKVMLDIGYATVDRESDGLDEGFLWVGGRFQVHF